MKFRLLLGAFLIIAASGCAYARDREIARIFPDAEVARFVSCVADHDGQSLAPCKLAASKLNYRGSEDWGPLSWLLVKERVSPQSMVALIKMGADPHSGSSPSAAGYAVEVLPITYLKALVESEIDINDVTHYDKGERRGWRDALIFSAIKSRDYEKVKYLVDRGADLEVRNYSGQTPILSADTNLYDMQMLFLEKGADSGVVDKSGYRICDPIETEPLVESASEYEPWYRDEVERDIAKRTKFIAMLEERGIKCVLGARRVDRVSPSAGGQDR